MKIYVFGTRGFPLVQGGVEKHCENIYPLIAQHAEVVVYRRKPYIPPSNKTQYPGIRFVDLPSTRIKGFETVWHSFLCTVHILTQPSGIVHIHNIGPAMFTPLLRLFKRKVALTYHSPNYEHQKWNFAERYLLKICEKIALRYANVIIFVNRFRMETFASQRRRQQHYYLPNGINPPALSDSTGYLEKWGVHQTRYIVAIGRITPEKGFDILIKAFTALQTGYKLVIAGSAGAETGYYRQLTGISDPHNVIFTGYVYGEALNQLYSHASLFVLPSLHEGFPLVLLEAMSYRLPLIVSDIPATHLVDLPPQNYFPAGDVDALKDKLAAFCQNAQNPRPSYDLSHYNWDKIAEQTRQVLLGHRPVET